MSTPQVRHRSLIAAGIYLIGYALAQAVWAFTHGFHPAVNDVLGVLAIADGISFDDVSTLHNGFFPFGLPLLMALLPHSSVLTVTGLLSLAGAVLTLACVWAIAARLANGWWALAAIVLLSVDPLFLAYATSPGPDLLALGIAMLGVLVYVRESGRTPAAPRLWVVALAGVVIGLSGLLRYHSALLGIALLAWALLQPHRRLATVGVAAAGLVAGFLPQIVVNLAGGFGPLESDSAFTMYQSVVDINWQATSALDKSLFASPLTVIADHPWDFGARYLASLDRFALPIAVLALAVLVRRAGRSPILFSLLIGAIGYAVVVSTGNSPRGLLPVLALASVGVAVVADWLFALTAHRVPALERAVAVGVILVVLVGAPRAAESVAVMAARSNAEQVRANVEALVVGSGLVTRADQILTNDFDFYLTETADINPDRIGGWPAISLNGRTPQDDVDLSSVSAFACDAAARGIRLVLWSPGGVPGMDPSLEAALNGASTTSRLKNVGPIGGFVGTVVQPGYDCP